MLFLLMKLTFTTHGSAHSPDLTPLIGFDFYWGTPKGIVYQDIPTTPEHRGQHIID
jgi:hypothetical protein